MGWGRGWAPSAVSIVLCTLFFILVSWYHIHVVLVMGTVGILVRTVLSCAGLILSVLLRGILIYSDEDYFDTALQLTIEQVSI